MDRVALDWLFSTASQTLATLVGLIFAGVVFITNLIFIMDGISIIMDMLLLVFNPIEQNLYSCCCKMFNMYILVSGLVLLLNIISFVFSLKYIINVARPDFFEETVKRMSKEITEGEIDAIEFIKEYIIFDGILRSLPIFKMETAQKPLTLTSMIWKLRTLQYINQDDQDKIARLINTRNLILHGNTISHVSKETFEEMKECVRKITELRNKLVEEKL